MATVAGERLFGKAIKRREDPRFITGRGQYVDDVKLPGMTYAAFVRSQHAHAKIRRIDASAALKHPGVVAVFTGKDMTGVNSLPCGWRSEEHTSELQSHSDLVCRLLLEKKKKKKKKNKSISVKER